MQPAREAAFHLVKVDGTCKQPREQIIAPMNLSALFLLELSA
jgi:hypothetical protein